MSLNNCSIKALTDKLSNFPLFEKAEPASVLNKFSFFSDIDAPLLNDAADSIVISEFPANTIICRHGMFDKQFHIIITGRAKAFISTDSHSQYTLFHLSRGDFFGEEILFSHEPRSNSILTVEETTTLSMSREILGRLMEGSDQIKSLMDIKYIDRKLKTDLRRVSVFTLLSDELIETISKNVDLMTLPEKKVIFSEGDEGDAFYLIRSGKVNVLRNMNGEQKLVSILGAGQFFGEMSLISEENRNATVEVSETADLVKISRNVFSDIVNSDGRLLNEFRMIADERKKVRDDILLNPNTALVTRRRLDLDNELYRHFDVISHCTVDTALGSALLATIPDSRYPYVYPRDSACASRFLFKVVTASVNSGELAFGILENIARFILNCQRKDGYWGQRYGIRGEDKSIYLQEDNVAHGVIILCRYLLAARFREKRTIDVDTIISAIDRGARYACSNYYRKGIHLFYSTTSIHESAIEAGYSIWVNYAYLLMLNLVERIAKEYSVLDRFSESLTLKEGFESNIDSVFCIHDRYVRRLKRDGNADLRPDITLMSPFYFSTGMDVDHFKDNHNFRRSIEFIEQTLWDPDLGMLQRYLPFIEDPHTHVHAGNGPWIPYTSMLAQYYFYKGDISKGNRILELIDTYSTREGHYCEHLTTPERFHEFQQLEWINGKDIEKELLVKEILIPGIPYDIIVEELNHMKKAYDRVEAECNENGNRRYITFATPLMWSHAEYAMALLLRAEKELEQLEAKMSRNAP